jgi:hypothetical protein
MTTDRREATMKLFSSSLLILVGFAGAAWAQPVGAPSPEMAGGIVGMTLAAGAVYLINRRRRG